MAIAHLACLDGVVGPAATASIPVTDEGLLRGDGAFEVIRLYDGRPFALADHLGRLERSATSLRLPVDLEALRADVAAILEQAGAAPEHGALRIVLTRGGRRLLLTESVGSFGPVRLASVTYAPPRLLDGVKSLSYAANMLATRLAQERGADEALLVTPHGRVLEAPTSSIFWVADGILHTPPLEDHILASITRSRIMELAEVRERSCALEEVLAAEEAFLASSLREAQPVAAIDGHELPHAGSAEGGPVARETARALRARIEAELR